MASGKDATPPHSPRGAGDSTPSRQKGADLTIRTPGLESGKRRYRESPEATKRREELQALAEAKQAELEEILLKLSEEKGKVVGEGLEETDNEESYDPLYDDSYESWGNMEEHPMETREGVSKKGKQKVGTAPGDGLNSKLLKLRATKASRSGLPLHSKEGRDDPFGPKMRVQKTRHNLPDDLTESDSSSGEEELPMKHKKDARKVVTHVVEESGSEQTTRIMARKALSRISASPFTEEICRAEPPRKFQPPRFTLYDGKSDPLAHYRHYMQVMTLWSWNNELMCRVFPSSLGDTALQWFHKLSAGSVSCWEQLAEEFVAHFLANTK